MFRTSFARRALPLMSLWSCLVGAGLAPLSQAWAQNTPSLSVADAKVLEGDVGQTILPLTVTLSQASDAPVSVRYATKNATASNAASSSSDYTPTSGTLTFEPGQTSKTIEVLVSGDTVYESSEILYLFLSASEGATIARASATATITNDDAALYVYDTLVTEGDSGTSKLVFRVSASLPHDIPDRTVTVDYATQDTDAAPIDGGAPNGMGAQNASAGEDYQAQSGTLTFTSSTSSQLVTVLVSGDTLAEADEKLQLRLSNATGAVIVRDAALGFIEDDDTVPHPVSLPFFDGFESGSFNSYWKRFSTNLSSPRIQVTTANAPNSGAYHASLADTSDELTVPLDVAGRKNLVLQFAFRNTDPYSYSSQSLPPSFSGHQQGEGVSISGDGHLWYRVADLKQTSYSFTTPTYRQYVVNLDAAMASAGISNASLLRVKFQHYSPFGYGAFFDDIRVTPDTSLLTVADMQATEGDSGSSEASFQVKLSAPSANPVMLSYATTSGTARSQADFTSTSGGDTSTYTQDYKPASGTLTFEPGETVKSIPITIFGDLIDDDAETFGLQLTNIAGAVALNTTARATIVGVDAPPTISISDARIIEGDSGTKSVMLDLILSQPSGKVISVEAGTTGNSATLNEDFSGFYYSHQLNADIVKRTISIGSIIGDTQNEPNETFFVSLANPLRATLGKGRGVVTIVNDDGPTPSSLSIDDIVVQEGDGGTTDAVFTVSQSEDVDNAVTVDYATADGSAVAGSDYDATSGTLSFAPHQMSAQITIPVRGDTRAEGVEKFAVVLSNPAGGGLEDARGEVTVNDNDALALNIVTTTGESAVGDYETSLREAIIYANARPGPDRISFNIPGDGPQTIAPTSPLPAITDALQIDGYTQPGAQPNTLSTGNDAVLKIVLSGAQATNGDGLTISAPDCVLRGLVINGFNSSGVVIKGATATGARVEGCFIGTDASGATLVRNGFCGILVFQGAADAVIGGTRPEARNLIAGNGNYGVLISADAGTGHTIQGCYIGTDASGTKKLGNGIDGVRLMSASNLVGGSQSGAGNLISGNGSNIGSGVVVMNSNNRVQGNFIGTDAGGKVALGNRDIGVVLLAFDNPVSSNLIGGGEAGAGNLISGNGGGILFYAANGRDNRVQGNLIGTDAGGTLPLGNTKNGIWVQIGANNLIGGVVSGEGNVVAFNGAQGVRVTGPDSVGNAIRGNRSFKNVGLGIDLQYGSETARIDPNDAGDGDSGPNGLQNSPVLQLARAASGTTAGIITGTLDSKPNAVFDIDFFANTNAVPSIVSEGEDFLGTQRVTTNGDGHANVSLRPSVLEKNRFVTATATDASGNTSEFSYAVTVSDDTTAPDLQITAPTNGARLPSLSAATGTARDNAGGSGLDAAKAITVLLYRYAVSSPARTTPAGYWDGTSWTRTATAANYRAATLNPDTGEWSYTLPLQWQGFDAGYYQITAYAVDRAGNKSALRYVFSINGGDTTAPVPVLQAPVKDGSYRNTQLPSAVGTVRDSGTNGSPASGVSRVSLLLYRPAVGSRPAGYWAGGSLWVATPNTQTERLAVLKPFGEAQYTWQVRLPGDSLGMGDGLYALRLQTRDVAGNAHNFPYSAFRINNGATKSDLASAGSGATLSTASASANAITLAFTSALDADSAAQTGVFEVRVNGVAVEVSGVQIGKGATSLALTLAQELHSGDEIEVEWTGLHDGSGRTLQDTTTLTAR